LKVKLSNQLQSVTHSEFCDVINLMNSHKSSSEGSDKLQLAHLTSSTVNSSTGAVRP